MRALALLVLCGFSVTDQPNLDRVANAMRTTGVEFATNWETCGQVNAFYNPEKKSVTLCTELLTVGGPAFVRFVYAHEIAHAVIIQRRIPYTGSHETAADELATVMLILYGDGAAVDEAAEFWWARKRDMPPWDDHADDKERGFRMACLLWGSRGENAGCYERWVHSRDSWLRMLYP